MSKSTQYRRRYLIGVGFLILVSMIPFVQAQENTSPTETVTTITTTDGGEVNTLTPTPSPSEQPPTVTASATNTMTASPTDTPTITVEPSPTETPVPAVTDGDIAVQPINPVTAEPSPEATTTASISVETKIPTATHTGSIPQSPQCAAMEIVSYTPGTDQQGRELQSEFSNPNQALGTAQDDDTDNFVALGFGGSIVLSFTPRAIVNSDGNDFHVIETTFNDTNRPWEDYPEQAQVFASVDGTQWTQLGIARGDTEFDLGTLDTAGYIYIQDTSDPENFDSGSANGFDVDGVEGFLCDEVSLPTAVPTETPLPSASATVPPTSTDEELPSSPSLPTPTTPSVDYESLDVCWVQHRNGTGSTQWQIINNNSSPLRTNPDVKLRYDWAVYEDFDGNGDVQQLEQWWDNTGEVLINTPYAQSMVVFSYLVTDGEARPRLATIITNANAAGACGSQDMPTSTLTSSPTLTVTPSPTATLTASPTVTPSLTPTALPTPTETPTTTPSSTAIPNVTPTALPFSTMTPKPEICAVSSVTSYTPGLRKDGDPLRDVKSQTDLVLGPAQNDNTQNSVSLGFDGSIVLSFAPQFIVNRPGDDLQIFESTNDWDQPWEAYPEQTYVFASVDGEEWVSLGIARKDATFDLGELEAAQYIRLQDVSDVSLFRPDYANGFDVDAIEAVECTENIIPTITPADTATATETLTPTHTATITPTDTATTTPTATDTLTPTNTVISTTTPTAIATLTERPSETPVNISTPTQLPDTCMATTIVSYTPGVLGNGERLDDIETTSFQDTVSLGFGGSIILSFAPNYVENQSGDDIRVFGSFSGGEWENHPEQAHVFVSENGESWHSLGVVRENATFDLGDLDAVQYVRVQDASNPAQFADDENGFDVRRVDAMNCTEIRPVTPTAMPTHTGTMIPSPTLMTTEAPTQTQVVAGVTPTPTVPIRSQAMMSSSVTNLTGFTIRNSRFKRNQSASNGGGLYIQGQSDGVLVEGSVFTDNQAENNGGAIHRQSDSLTVNGGCIANNRSSSGVDGLVSATGIAQVDATGNWWGASDGPSGVAGGSGDAVSGNVDYAGFLTAPIAGVCDDTTQPILVERYPADGAIGMNADTNIVLTFDEPMQPGGDLIVLWDWNADEWQHHIQPDDTSQITYNGTQVIINPSPDLVANTDTRIVLREDAFRDMSGNSSKLEIWYFTVTDPEYCEASYVGYFSESNRDWELRHSQTSGSADQSYLYGSVGDAPLMGDWNGDGVDTPGVQRGNTYLLKNSHASGTADIQFNYGDAADVPVAGDWDGDGIDTIGLYRPTTGMWYLRNSNSAGSHNISIQYGPLNETPVAGDWNGDGIDTIGIFRSSDRRFFLRHTNEPTSTDTTFLYGAPNTDIPVVGDWNGDCIDTIGVYRPSDNGWYLRNSNTSGTGNVTFEFTTQYSNLIPLTGHWGSNSTP